MCVLVVSVCMFMLVVGECKCVFVSVCVCVLCVGGCASVCVYMFLTSYEPITIFTSTTKHHFNHDTRDL